MSRTYRKVNRQDSHRMFRAPRTKNEQSALVGILADLANDIEPEFNYAIKFAKYNRISSKANTLPNSYSDIDISALESKY